MIMKLLLCIIIIRIVLVVLFLLSGWNCTPVVKYQFTCPEACHKKMLLFVQQYYRWSPSMVRRYTEAWTLLNLCVYRFWRLLWCASLRNTKFTRCHCLWRIEFVDSCSLLLFHPIHSYCSHCYFVYCFQGTMVVVGSCIYCTITTSRMKYCSSLFSWSY